MGKKKEPKRIWQPITPKQAGHLWTSSREPDGTRTKLYEMIHQLIGIPALSFLSLQEADYLIRRITGAKVLKMNPSYSKKEEWIDGGACMPTWGQMTAIRKTFVELGWNKVECKAWLAKYHKTKFRHLDRDTSQKVYRGLVQIQINRMKGRG